MNNGDSVSSLGQAPPTQTPWVRWQLVVLLMALSFVSWFHRKSMTVAADERLMKEYEISPEDMGFVYSSLLFTYMVCMTPGGWFIDRFGARLALFLMAVGLAVFGVLTGLVGVLNLASPLIFFLIIRGLMGIFATPMYPASAQAIGLGIPFGQRGLANGMVQGAALVGIATAPWIFGRLIDAFNWPMAFFFLSGATALIAVLWVVRVSDPPVQVTRPGQEVPGSWYHLLSNRHLMLLTLSYAALGYFEYLFFFWMEYYFQDRLSLSNDVRRTYALVVYLSMAVGMFLGGALSDACVRRFGHRVGRAMVPMGGLVLGAGFLILGILLTDPNAIVACFSIALAAGGSTEAPFWTTSQDLGRRRGGTAAAICNTGGNAGGLIAPIATPIVGQMFGWPVAVALGSLVCILGAALWFFIDPTYVKKGEE